MTVIFNSIQKRNKKKYGSLPHVCNFQSLVKNPHGLLWKTQKQSTYLTKHRDQQLIHHASLPPRPSPPSTHPLTQPPVPPKPIRLSVWVKVVRVSLLRRSQLAKHPGTKISTVDGRSLSVGDHIWFQTVMQSASLGSHVDAGILVGGKNREELGRFEALILTLQDSGMFTQHLYHSGG